MPGSAARPPAHSWRGRGCPPGSPRPKRAVRKAAIRAQALAAMDAALKAGSSAGVYAARDALVARYADLAEDRALIARMRDANELIRRAVPDRSLGPSRPRPSPRPIRWARRRAWSFGRPDRPRRRPRASGAVVHALADGFAYGLSAPDGAPLWQLPVGLSSPFPPQPIPGSAAVLAFDARFDDADPGRRGDRRARSGGKPSASRSATRRSSWATRSSRPRPVASCS